MEYGRTEQNRPLLYLKISSNTTIDIEKPTVVIEAGINPREWATIPAALNIVSKITEEENRSLIDDLVWIIIPVLNPDGYEYTHTNVSKLNYLISKEFLQTQTLGKYFQQDLLEKHI